MSAHCERELKKLSKKYRSIRQDVDRLITKLETNPQMGTPLRNSCYKIRLAITSKRKGKPGDLRFTQRDNTVYVFSMEKPNGDIAVKSLAGQISSVKLLGSGEKVEWSQNDSGLTIKQPNKLPDFITITFAVVF